MSEWVTDGPPDFTKYGFHTGHKVQFRLATGEEKIGIYVGWEVFNANGTDYTNVAAWRPFEINTDAMYEGAKAESALKIAEGGK